MNIIDLAALSLLPIRFATDEQTWPGYISPFSMTCAKSQKELSQFYDSLDRAFGAGSYQFRQGV